MKRPTFATICAFLGLALAALSSVATAAERNIIFIITDDESPTLGAGDRIRRRG